MVLVHSLVDLAQGEVKGFPHHFEMKNKVSPFRVSEPFRFTLVADGVEQEVQFVRERGHGSPGDGSWWTELVVCPVETFGGTNKGARLIHVDIDPFNHATYL